MIRITTSVRGSNMEITICNSGSRIDPEDADKLFVPFYSTRDGGTGLGLAISRIIIERHGGSITVMTEDDMVCFRIVIPVESTFG